MLALPRRSRRGVDAAVLESVLFKVFFYYKAASNASDFWISEAKLWSKDVDKFT